MRWSANSRSSCGEWLVGGGYRYKSDMARSSELYCRMDRMVQQPSARILLAAALTRTPDFGLAVRVGEADAGTAPAPSDIRLRVPPSPPPVRNLNLNLKVQWDRLPIGPESAGRILR
jgi:hypothetical protein